MFERFYASVMCSIRQCTVGNYLTPIHPSCASLIASGAELPYPILDTSFAAAIRYVVGTLEIDTMQNDVSTLDNIVLPNSCSLYYAGVCRASQTG